MTKKISIGMDLGIASVGSAVTENDNLVYMGTHVFDKAEEAKVSRVNRGQRRNVRRKTWRKEQLKDAFADFDIIPREDFNQKGYSCFTTNPESKVARKRKAR